MADITAEQGDGPLQAVIMIDADTTTDISLTSPLDEIESDGPVVVFSQPSCGPCIGVKRDLDRLGVDYVVANIQDPEHGEAYLAKIKALGFDQTPVVVAGDSAWLGHRPKITALISTRVSVAA